MLNFDAMPTRSYRARSEDTVKNPPWLPSAALAGGGAFVGHIGVSDFIAVLARAVSVPLQRRTTFDAKRDVPGRRIT